MAPEIFLNCAASIDGRIARAGGAQTPLSNLADRWRVQALRASVGAVVVGSGTIRNDDPHLTVKPALAARWLELVEQRPELEPWSPEITDRWVGPLTRAKEVERLVRTAKELEGRKADSLEPGELEAAQELWKLNPRRVILDGQGRTPDKAKVVDCRARTLIFTSQLGSVQLWGRFSDWPNVEVVLMDKAHGDEGVDLDAVLKGLANQGIGKALVEGGARILGAFITARRAGSLTTFYRSCVLGQAGVPMANLGISSDEHIELELEKTQPIPALEEGDWEGLLVRYHIGSS